MLGLGLWATLLVACGSSERPACLPVDLEPKITKMPPVEEAGPVVVWVDASGSMAGYLRRGKPLSGDIPYKDLIQTLPQWMDMVASKVDYFRFGKTVQAMSRGDFLNAARESFYRDPRLKDSSRISDPIAKAVEQDASVLTVIITDLFLSGAELDLSASGALRRPLTQALQQGKHVALLGIRNPFSDKIYDLSGGKPLDYTGERPFYLILIGPETRIATLYRRLQQEILSNLPADYYHFTLFTPDLIDTPAPSTPSTPRNSGIKPARILKNSQPNMAQFAVERDSAPLVLDVPLAPLKTPPRLTWSSLQLREQLYHYTPRQGRCEWDLVELPPLGKLETANVDAVKIQLFSERERILSLPKGGIFVLALDVVATQLAPASPDWAKAWSFKPGDEERLRTELPPFFPTPHLAHIAEVMASIVSEHYQPETLATAYVVFQIQ
ncbi:MAG: hypothetical protein EKK69_02520 [Candidatus Competibacteraceae bacterium]|nr:MAG: hypothetical protein EKK69_02520 [Candidatus Competibacteraceae bacterium]